MERMEAAVERCGDGDGLERKMLMFVVVCTITFVCVCDFSSFSKSVCVCVWETEAELECLPLMGLTLLSAVCVGKCAVVCACRCQECFPAFSSSSCLC